MSNVRRYVLPGTEDERRALVEEVARHYREVLGVPARPALTATWWRTPVGELRRIAGNWRGLLRRRAERSAGEVGR